MTELENFKLLGIALAIGLLIGLERGWRIRDRDEGMRVLQVCVPTALLACWAAFRVSWLSK